jgi:hypothetical protein
MSHLFFESRSKYYVHLKNQKSIKTGEELLDNYINFVSDIENFASDIKFLKLECGGEVDSGFYLGA